MKNIILPLAALAAVAVIVAACSAEKIVPPKVEEKMYRVEAILVKDLLTDSASVFVTLTRSKTAYKGADVYFKTLPVDTTADGYFRRFGPDEVFTDSSYILTIIDDTTLDTELTFTVPDSFEINKRYRFFIGGEESVTWTPSANADGFILATVPPEIYDLAGYSVYVNADRGTIPPGTFLDELNARISGTHLIYVAAYIGAPIQSPALPFVVPSVNIPADNVSGDDIAGRIAGMVVATPDSIIVPD